MRCAKGFVGTTTLARQVGMLVVHPSLPARTTKEFIELAKSQPGEVIYGSAGNGSFVHLTMALFASMTGLKMIHVPYKGGGPSGTGRYTRLPKRIAPSVINASAMPKALGIIT
ncbi:MAG: Bug family tripartite tricarboxylate transporter substrate binding protein [Burkholderiales bacterium]